MQVAPGIVGSVVATLLAVGCGKDAPPSFEPIGVDGQHEHLAIGDGRVWLAEDDRVIGVDPVRGEAATPVRRVGPGAPVVTAIAAGAGGVYALVLSGKGYYVVAIDARTGRPGARTRVRLSPPSERELWDRDLLALGEGRVLAARRGSSRVVSVDPVSGERAALRTRAAQDVAVGGGYAWIAESPDRGPDAEPAGAGALVRSAPNGRARRRIELAEAPAAIAWGGDSLWVLSRSRVTRMDRDGRQLASIPLGDDQDATVGAIAASDEAVWLFTNPFRDGRLMRIDPESNKLTGQVVDPPGHADPYARQLAVRGREAWLAGERTVLVRVPAR